MRYNIGSWLFNIWLILWTAGMGLLFAPWALVALRGAKVCGRLWARGVLFMLHLLCGITWEVRGREHIVDGPAIYASRHQSAWDTVALLYLLDCPAFVLKRELLWLPIYGWHLKQLQMIAINRSKGASAIKHILQQVKDRLAAGRNVVIFPEGTRRPPEEPGDYQPGIAAMYRTADAPVVPVALNSGHCWGRNALVKTPGHIVIEFLPPMERGLDKQAFLQQLKTRIEGVKPTTSTRSGGLERSA